MTELTKLINNIEMLFTVFVPGAMCIWCYSKLALKKLDYQGYFVSSITLGFVIKHFVDLFLKSSSFTFQIIVYIAVGIILAVVYYKIKNAPFVRYILSKYFGIDSGDNIWTRHIDFENGTSMILYLDDGRYVAGRIENADNDYIVLNNHAEADSPDGEDMQKALDNPIQTALCIPMSHIKRFEFVYTSSKESSFKRFILKN